MKCKYGIDKYYIYVCYAGLKYVESNVYFQKFRKWVALPSEKNKRSQFWIKDTSSSSSIVWYSCLHSNIWLAMKEIPLFKVLQLQALDGNAFGAADMGSNRPPAPETNRHQTHCLKSSRTAACNTIKNKCEKSHEMRRNTAKKMRRKCEKFEHPKAYGKIRHFYQENTPLFHFWGFRIFSHFDHIFRIGPEVV